jgi:hypothetical protein
MKKILGFFIITIICLLNLVGSVYKKQIGDFKIINQWNLGDQGLLSSCGFLVKDNHIICICGKCGNHIIWPDRVINFAPRGQGPSDLDIVMTMCKYNDDVAFIGLSKKVKIFKRMGNTYKWKETKWIERSPYIKSFRDSIFYKGKWFFAGWNCISMDKKKNKSEIALIMVYDRNGKSIKSLIKKHINNLAEFAEYSIHMNCYIKRYKNRLFFLAESNLEVYEISVNKLKIEKIIELEKPVFYRVKPSDTYLHKKGYSRYSSKKLKDWRLSYSRITAVGIEDGHLVVQIRTCKEKQKKFTLLFYDINNFELIRTIFINHKFIGVNNGKYFFYKNGDPGDDEEADECIIKVYSFCK